MNAFRYSKMHEEDYKNNLAETSMISFEYFSGPKVLRPRTVQSTPSFTKFWIEF